MRVDALTQIQQAYGVNKVKKTTRPQSTSATAGSDSFKISAFGKELQMAKQAVGEAPDIRKEVTEPLKAAIKNGTYNVSSEAFADKLLEKLGGAI